jgi:predicted RND superfamily exporter protein
MDHIVDSQLSSFALAFVVIFTLIGLLFRSIEMAVLAVPANLLPVLATLGFMGLVGIRLDVATVTIAAIVLGLVVDDTTQFLYRYRHFRERSSDIAEVVGNTVRTVGRPMVITTVVLAGGFSVLGVASIKSVAFFGILLAVALISALLADLLVIPALLVLAARGEVAETEGAA